MDRRTFLKLTGLTAGSLFVPKILKGFGSETVNIYVPDVEGIKYNNSLVEVYDDFDNLLGTGNTIDSLASFLVTDVKDDNAIKTKANVDFDPISKNLSYNLDASSNVKVMLSDIRGRQRELYSGNGSYGENNIPLNLGNLSSGRYVITIQTDKYISNIMFTGNANTITGLKSSGIIPLGQKKVSNGSLKKALGDNYKVVVSGPDHYKRTFITPVASSIEDRVVGHVQQEGVDEQLFKDFYEESNNSTGSDDLTYTGLKTGFRTPNKKLIISNLDVDGSTVNDSGREYVKNVINNEILPYLKNSIDVEFRNYNSVNDIKLWIDGEFLILPGDRFGFAVGDPEKDGMINSGFANLYKHEYNSDGHNEIMEEICSLIFGYNDVNNLNVENKTILNHGNSIMPMDTKLIKMLEYYEPLEAKENILG